VQLDLLVSAAAQARSDPLALAVLWGPPVYAELQALQALAAHLAPQAQPGLVRLDLQAFAALQGHLGLSALPDLLVRVALLAYAAQRVRKAFKVRPAVSDLPARPGLLAQLAQAGLQADRALPALLASAARQAHKASKG